MIVYVCLRFFGTFIQGCANPEENNPRRLRAKLPGSFRLLGRKSIHNAVRTPQSRL